MIGFYLMPLLLIYIIIALIRDITEDFIDSPHNTPLILRVLYLLPKLIPLILIGGFFVLTITGRQI